MPCKKHFRFLATAILAALVVTLAVALPGVSADGDEDKNREIDQSEDQAPPLPDKTELNYPNLGSHLNGLVVQVEDGETTSQGAALDTPVHSGAPVAVTIHLTGSVDEVVSFLEDNGGDPRNVGDDYIEAYVPVSLLGQLSEQTGVIRVREIVPPQPAQLTQRIIGHGPPVHGSQAWNQAGYSGQGVKVGIIDTGFTGFSSLMGTELPTTVVARCYTDVGVFTQDLADCEAAPNVTDVRPPQCLDYVRRRAASGDSHGTIVAESLIDIAPGVELYIAQPQSPGDLQATAAWMASQGVSVINHSVGWFFNGPGDGTSPISASPLNTVDRAVASDVTWVNAAGNSADDTWFGGYSDPDGDRALRFGGQNNEIMGIFVGACRLYRVQLRWEDNWDGASTDLDLHLADRRTGEIFFSSDATQSGESGHVPLEWIWFRFAIEARDLGIAVTHFSGEAPDWVQITVWGPGSIQHYTKNGSIGNPAESANPGMLAVGAAHWNDVRVIEPYSSRGPTPDGRDKPDIVGADCGETALTPLNEYRRGFCGTSQAAPHVAGMAALVRQRFPSHTPAQVAAYLQNHAQQRETPDPNNTWGHGFAQLPSPDRSALIALYNATDGANWTDNTNWVTNAPVGQWYGVTTNGNGRVTEINLTRNQLKGEIPPELANLTNLKVLALGGNELTGTIPTWLGSLANLEELYLWGNELTGEIPSELGSLANLVELHLADNQLTGEVPVELGNLTNLKVLALGGNELTGTIPTWLGSLANLVELHLADNQLTGEIPVELGTLANLTSASLSQNQLTGAIPTELGSLANLEELWLSENQLTGEIPVELGSLSNLVKLVLWGNELTGEIPVELGTLANLTSVSLSQNQLTGEIPTELGSLANLKVLALGGNELTGTIPTWLGSLANLEELWLSENQLTGEIPVELGSLSDLVKLGLWGNELTGEIPAELGTLANLTSLSLSQNQLTGEIPTELGSLANLET